MQCSMRVQKHTENTKWASVGWFGAVSFKPNSKRATRINIRSSGAFLKRDLMFRRWWILQLKWAAMFAEWPHRKNIISQSCQRYQYWRLCLSEMAILNFFIRFPYTRLRSIAVTVCGLHRYTFHGLWRSTLVIVKKSHQYFRLSPSFFF